MNDDTNACALAQYAMDSSKSRGRLYKCEKINPFIDNFQEDTLRIIRSASFRRLAHKTQVFINDINKIDHYRSRLTHTLEVSVIGKIISKALGLSSSLTEAICLAHDIGHPPFGHAGEKVLNELLADYGGFNHNYHAFKLVTQIEEKYSTEYNGLNLSWEVLEGLIKHNGPLMGRYTKVQNIPEFVLEYNKLHKLCLDKFPSFEAQVASISDDISYIAHDLEDGLNARLFSLEMLLKEDFMQVINGTLRSITGNVDRKSIIYNIMSVITDFFIEDVVINSQMKITQLQINSIQDVVNHDELIVSFSQEGQKFLARAKEFLNKNMYRNNKIVKPCNKYKYLIRDVYKICLDNPQLLPQQWRNKKLELPILVGDYIVGMTDNFIIKMHKQLA